MARIDSSMCPNTYRHHLRCCSLDYPNYAQSERSKIKRTYGYCMSGEWYLHCGGIVLQI
jgi:hypothetical protein